MLVRRDLGFPSPVFLVVVVVVSVTVFVIRRKWRHSVARNEEIKRLVVSASEELARAEFEAREAYYYTATPTPSARVSVPTSPSVPTSVSVPLGSPWKPQYQCAVCFCPTTTRCAKCKAVRYCSGKCQIIHWRQGHKYECRPPYVAASPSNDVGGRQTDDGDQSDSFDTEAQQTATGRYTDHKKDDVVGAEFVTHQQGTNSTSTPTTKYPAGGGVTIENIEAVGSPVVKKNHKKLNVSGEDDSSCWTNDGSSSSSEPSTTTTSSFYIHNKSSVDDFAPLTNEINVGKVIDGKSNHNIGSSKDTVINDGSKSRGLPKSTSNQRDAGESHRASVIKDDKVFTGLPFSVTERLNEVPNHKTSKSSKEVASSSPNRHVTHTTKPVKVDDDNQLTGIRSGPKTAKVKAVDQVKLSKVSRQDSLDVGSESTHKYAFKGLFPYDMFVKLYTSKKVDLQPCGLKNCGNSCYANAVLQCLIYTPPLTAYFLQGFHSRACDKRGRCFTCELESLVMKAKDGNSPLSPIRILTHIENIGSNLGHGKQEDAHEFLRYVIDALQAVCIKEAGKNALNSFEEETTLIGLTFGGYLRSKIICMKCGGKSERHERMMDLTVEIEGDIGTLEEALDKFTCVEVLDGENKYKCSRCKSYEKAKKKLTLLEAPNVLTIALKRFQSGKFGKLNKSIQFPEILDMAPYVSGTSDKSPIYRLYGAVVHVDTMNDASSGHYVCYVKSVQNRWFKFNDSVVSEVDLQHVLTKGAYMLLYARCSPRAPRSIRHSMIQHNDPRKHKTTGFVPKSEPWGDHHPNAQPPVAVAGRGAHRHRSLEEESSSSSDNNSGFFSESCSCSTDSSTQRDSNAIEDHIPGDWDHDDYYWNNKNMNINLNSSDSDTSSTSSFPSPLYSRLSHLYTNECRNLLDCSCNTCTSTSSRVTTNLDRLGASKPKPKPVGGVTFRRSAATRAD